MPNVVDISTIPAFNAYTAYTNLFHQVSTNYNAAFNATLNRARTNCPGLTIYVPDFFALLTNLLAHPANYGVTNALKNKLSIDALGALGNPSLTNGPGTNYIFWDPQDPTAMVHTVDGQSCPATHLTGMHQPAHCVRRQQPAGFGQRSDWPEWYRHWLHESFGDKLADQCHLYQFQCDAIGLCPRFRRGVVLSVEIPLFLDLAVILWKRRRPVGLPQSDGQFQSKIF